MQLGLKLNMYWDGETKPAVSAPIGYFFGMGLGEMYPFESALFSNPEGRSYNCIVVMPFKNGMKNTMAGYLRDMVMVGRVAFISTLINLLVTYQKSRVMKKE